MRAGVLVALSVAALAASSGSRPRRAQAPPRDAVARPRPGSVIDQKPVIASATYYPSVATPSDAQPVAVTLSQTGTASDAGGRMATDYTALAFSVDSRRWYAESRFVKFARPSTDARLS
jgi:hypothetical protein